MPLLFYIISLMGLLTGCSDPPKKQTGMNDAQVEKKWWKEAVVYQIYPRSFADSNGDGMGDLPGITARMDSLAALGIDAIWLSPFMSSPQKDAGYDVSNYRDVDPLFGTLADFDDMVARAHELGIRVLVDLVPNHTSDQHAWFQAALAAPEGSPEREFYHFKDGRGEGGELLAAAGGGALRHPVPPFSHQAGQQA